MKPTDNKALLRLMLASITRPINAALAGAGTLFTVAAVTGPHTPLLGLVGGAMLLGTLGSMGKDLGDKRFVREVLTEGEGMKALPEIPSALAGQYRLYCHEAQQHMEKTLQAIDSAGPEVADELQVLRDGLIQNVATVYRLAQRAHQTDSDLTSSSKNDILKDIEKVRAQMVLTKDPETRRHNERTLEQKEQQLATYEELATRVRRIQSQMQAINATLENIQFKVMKITTEDIRSGQASELNENLQRLLEDVRLFEQSFDMASNSQRLGAVGSLESWDERSQQRGRLPSGEGQNSAIGESAPGEIAPPLRTNLPPGTARS